MSSVVLGQRISYRSAAGLLLLSVSIAYLSARVTISPLTLLILSPLTVLVSCVAFVGLDVWASWILARRVSARLERGDSLQSWARRPPQRSRVNLLSAKRSVPPLAFTSPAAWSVAQTRAQWDTSKGAVARPAWAGATAALSDGLNVLLGLIGRDFVWSWYGRISDSPAFPVAVDGAIREALLSIATRAVRVDWSDVLVGRILPLITSHISTFRAAELALRGQDMKTSLTESAELDLFLAQRYATEAGKKLHPAVDVASPNSRPAEEAWLSGLVGQLVPHLLPEREAESGAVRVIVRELVGCAVLVPIVDTLSDPDFYNRIIDDKAGAAIRDQQMVNQFREALDKQGPNLTSQSVAGIPSHPSYPSSLSRATGGNVGGPVKRSVSGRFEEISVRTNTKQFESFVKGIGKCNNLLDARRLRSDVSGQVRKARLAIEGRASDELVQGARVSAWEEHIHRLTLAKAKADQRIAALGGTEGSSRLSVAGETPRRARPRVTLREILISPTSLGYFMEFAERRKRSLLVQFWCLVEGLKDPLEHDAALGDSLSPSLGEPTQSQMETTRDDMVLLWDAYFCQNTIKAKVKHVARVREFVARGADVGGPEVRAVLRAVFDAQRDVLQEMEEEDFAAFKRSELYFKALADLPDLTASPATPDPPSLPLPPFEAAFARQRASSHPDSTPIWSTPDRSPARSESPRPTSPTPLFGPSKMPMGLQRTETAPPQVTFRAVFDDTKRPPAIIRAGSDGGSRDRRDLGARKASTNSLDSFAPPTGKKKATMSDSLDFLFSSPAEDREDVNRSPLFGDDGEEVEDEEGEGLDEEDEDYVQIQTIEAIQEALNSILATDAKNGQPTTSNKGSQSLSSSLTLDPNAKRRSSAEMTVPKLGMSKSPRSPVFPIAALTKPGTSSATPSERVPSGSSTKSTDEAVAARRKAVFDDEDSLEVDALEPEDLEPAFDPQTIKVAAPGDLELAVEIDRLGQHIDKLRHQEAVVGALIRKAELTGIASELKILAKSRESLRREMRATEFQKRQYEVQEEENQIEPGRTNVSISGTTVGQAEGQSFQLYLVEVHQLASDGTYGSGWIVTRRYSEFDALRTQLNEKFLQTRKLDFPAKRLVNAYSNEGFIEHRRVGLESYLQSLVKIASVCGSKELRSFLSQQNISLPKLDDPSSKSTLGGFLPGQGLVRSFYKTVTAGIDDMLGAGPASMMDTVIRQLSLQAEQLAGGGANAVAEEDLVNQLNASGLLQSDNNPAGAKASAEEGLTYFTGPICDLFVTVFSLREKNNWLRRQAILIILQQVLGGTIERKFRDGVKMLVGPEQVTRYVDGLRNTLWPGGERRPPGVPRTERERATTRESASRKLSALMPDLAANLIGKHNARQGARRLFAVLQNRRLNRHLIYSIIEVVVSELFPELNAVPPSRPLPTQFHPRPAPA